MNHPTSLNLKTALCALLACLGATFAEESDASLNALFKDYLDEHFRQQPLDATQLGEQHARQTLEALPRKVVYTKLSRAGQIDFEIFKQELIRMIWLAENTRPFEEDPRTYNGYINDSVYLVLTQSTLPKETNVANCIARMAQIPKIITAAKNSLRRPPRPILETAIRQNRGAISFYENGILELVGETPQRDALRAAAAPVAELLKGYQKFLEGALMSRATGDWRLGTASFGASISPTCRCLQTM